MRRFVSVLVLFFCAVLLLFSGSIVGDSVSTAQALDYNLVGQERVSEGTHLYRYNLNIGGQTLPARMLEVDLSNPYVEIQAMHPREGFNERQTVREMAGEQGAVAAVNADFFHLARPAAPFGLHMEEKQIISSPSDDRSWLGFGIDENRTAHITNWLFSGEVISRGTHRYQLYGYNQTYRNDDNIFLYDRNWGKEVSSVFFEGPVLKVLVQNGIVQQVIENAETVSIPHDGFVLIAEGKGAAFLKEHASAGTTLEYRLGIEPPQKLDMAVGGHVVLVADGSPVDSSRLPSPGATRASRTAVGMSSDGKKVFFVTIDGTPALAGATMEELALFMSRLGASRALNLDGGGSTAMVSRKLGEFEPQVVSRLRHGFERSLPSAIGIFNRAPRTEEAAKLFLRGVEGLLKGTEADYTVTGHDRHYHPLRIEPGELSWEVSDPERAAVERGTLKAKQAGEISLKVSFQGAVEEKKVRIYGGEDVTALITIPAEIRLLPEQSVPLQAKVETYDGLTLEPAPGSVTWEADIGHVEDGTYYAGTEKGFGTLTAEFDGHRQEIPVRIGGKRESFFTFREWQTTSFRSHPAGLPGSFEVQSDFEYTYTGERSGRLRYDFSRQVEGVMIAYGQLGSGQISMGKNNIGISAYIHGDKSGYWLRAEVVSADGQRRYVDLAKELDWEGWQRVQGALDPSWPQPLVLSSIYLVQEPEKRTGAYPQEGTIYIDDVEMVKGLDEEDEREIKEKGGFPEDPSPGRDDDEISSPGENDLPSTVEMWIGSRSYEVNGQAATMEDAVPFIEEGRTFVPVRFLGEAFEAEADWTSHPESGLTEKVTLENEEILIALHIGEFEFTVLDKASDEQKSFQADAAPLIVNGRTYLPFRAIGEYGFGAEVGFTTFPDSSRVESVWFER